MPEITCTPSIAGTIGGRERVYHAFPTTAAPHSRRPIDDDAACVDARDVSAWSRRSPSFTTARPARRPHDTC